MIRLILLIYLISSLRVNAVSSLLSCSRNAQAITGKRSRHDDVVTFFVFGNGFVHPVSTAEGYVVPKLIFQSVQSRVSIRRRDPDMYCIDGTKVGNRPLPVVVSSGETRVYACDKKCQRQEIMTCQIWELANCRAPPDHAHERVINVHTNYARLTPAED
jgi:hypothetical protein